MRICACDVLYILFGTTRRTTKSCVRFWPTYKQIWKSIGNTTPAQKNHAHSACDKFIFLRFLSECVWNNTDPKYERWWWRPRVRIWGVCFVLWWERARRASFLCRQIIRKYGWIKSLFFLLLFDADFSSWLYK